MTDAEAGGPWCDTLKVESQSESNYVSAEETNLSFLHCVGVPTMRMSVLSALLFFVKTEILCRTKQRESNVICMLSA